MTAYRMSVDPGIEGTGIALWNAEQWSSQLVLPTAICTLTYRNMLQWNQRALFIKEEFRRIVNHFQPEVIYCELPKNFESAVGVAATAEGSIVKLAFLIGLFAGTRQHGKFELIGVNEWKGQLPKHVVERRIIGLLPDIINMHPKSHEWDAIGIGLYAQGFRLDQ